jgi:hypothetical protein
MQRTVLVTFGVLLISGSVTEVAAASQHHHKGRTLAAIFRSGLLAKKLRCPP